MTVPDAHPRHQKWSKQSLRETILSTSGARPGIFFATLVAFLLKLSVSVFRGVSCMQSVSGRIQDPGCSAAALLSVDLYNVTSRKCFLTVRPLQKNLSNNGAKNMLAWRINQTDFDELDGTAERIESVKACGMGESAKI